MHHIVELCHSFSVDDSIFDSPAHGGETKYGMRKQSCSQKVAQDSNSSERDGLAR
jgi:hypothetical protein